ncbi:MerR family transcriptional regulator [Kineococcus gynurae]|uniref:MerR family transcriptional regulator n=1 Tax=Kineococcus gynurae TaxID=452979 RepID=A0ABV5LPW3_9ACTN
MDQDEGWRIGELAGRTGVTVRTLHHYDAVGLLHPSGRTVAGHRRYAPADVERLYRVLALRALGMGLAEIGEVLQGTASLRDLAEAHLARVDEQLLALQRLRSRLTTVVREAVTDTDVLDLVREVSTVQEYFTPEQLETLQQRRVELGEDVVRATEERWPTLIAEVEEAVAAGVDPSSPRGQELLAEWQELLHRFHGGDPELRNALFRMNEENTEQIQRDHGGPSPVSIDFITRAGL